VTFAGCATDFTQDNLAANETTVPTPQRQSTVQREAMVPGSTKPRAKKITGSTDKRSKATAKGWRLESKTAIPLLDEKLLQPPIESNCELEYDPEFKIDDPRRLDLEKQCYRESAIITRNHLLLLQTAVKQMIETPKQ
jgi:hypothetical protein